MSLAFRPKPSGSPHSPTPTTASSMGYSAYAASSAPGRGHPSSRPQPRPRPSDSDKGDSREIAKVHWRALRDFLSSWLARESPTSRASAREKLTRLTKLQFQELSTDVYDELVRRQIAEREGPNGGTAAPFLPVRDDFHPKRNQARQKLATLPRNRFKDLASDVFYELRRRYPEFEEAEANDSRSEISFSEPPPAPGPVQSSRPAYHQSTSSTSLPPTQPPMNRLASSSSQRSGNVSINSRSDSREQMYANSAANEVVVPNKSRLREEEIEVPYARESVVNPELEKMRSSSRNGSRNSHRRDSRDGSYASHGQREGNVETSPVATENKDYFDRMSFSSNLTSRSKAQGGNAHGWDDEREEGIRREYELKIANLERRLATVEAERDEALHSEKNHKERSREGEDETRGLKERAATHATSLRSLQHELDLARDSVDAARRQGEASARDARQETAEWRDRCAGLEEDLRHLEEERQRSGQESHGNDEAVQLNHELQTEVVSLLNELKTLSIRHDELQQEREQDGEYVRELEAKVEEYKKKWETVRMELRNLKATSTMFTSKPVSDDHLPASADGNIADINVQAFQAAIDTLLSAARSSTPTGVLPAMKGVVVATADISEDVKAFEAHPNLDVDVSQLESLKHQSTSTLNALMQAARNHAMSSGLSPVSLLDAAAGHVTANVVEIIKLLKIRRVGKPDPRNSIFMREPPMMQSQKTERLREEPIRRGSSPFEPQRGMVTSPSGTFSNGFSSSQPSRGPSRGMSLQSDSFELERKPSIAMDRPEQSRRQSINNRISQGSATTSGASSIPPPAVFDTPVAAEHPPYGRSESMTPEQEAEDDRDDDREWDELKPYLEKQSSALVNSIQNLLAAIRSGGQGPALNEHLSEVIAIGSSIVAVSTDSLPGSLRPEGDGLLKDLVENTDKLSEAQSQPEFTKAIRQQIASASFGLAKSLKALMKLGT